MATISRNIITVDSGTVSKGISTGVSCKALYSDNQLAGLGTFTTTVEVYAGQISRANTLNGILTSDQVAKYQLSTDANKKILAGSTSITVSAGTAKKQLTIPFNTTFGTIPIVVATLDSSTALADVEYPFTVSVYSISTTQFAITVTTNGNVSVDRNLTIGWIAIG